MHDVQKNNNVNAQRDIHDVNKDTDMDNQKGQVKKANKVGKIK